MIGEIEPVEGNWYSNLEAGRDFTVLTVDEDAGVVEIQYLDGDVDEIDLADWSELDLEISEPPDDWGDSLDRDLVGLNFDD